MPNETTAQFTDMMQLTVDVGTFQASLDKVYAVYKETMASWGSDATTILGSGVSTQISELVTGIRQLSEDNLKAWQEMQQSITSIMEALGASEAALAAKSVALAEETAQKKIAAARKVQEEEDKNSDPKHVRVRTGSEQVEQAAGYANTEDAARAEKTAKYASDMAVLQAKANRENAAFDAQRQTETQKLGTLQVKAADEDAKRSAKKLKDTQDWGRMVEEANATNSRWDAKKLADLEKQRALYSQINAEARAAGESRNLGSNKSPAEQSASVLFKAQDAAQASAWVQTDKMIGQAEKRADSYYKKIDDAEAKLHSNRASMHNVTMDNLGNTLMMVGKIAVMWRLVGAAMQGVEELIAAPFKAVEEGLKYLRETERTTDLMMGTLAANVKYSDDLTENYKKLREAAAGSVRAIQDIAIKTHTPVETLTRVFQALVDGGVTRYTGSMQDVLTVTTMFAQAMKAAGAGGIALNSQIANLGQMMDGNAGSATKFLNVLKITPVEWNKILAQARIHGDLVAQLAPRMEPFIKALQAGSLHQAVLIEEFGLLRKQMEALGAATLYESLTAGLKTVTEWMQENSGRIIAFLSLVGNTTLELGKAFFTLLTSFGVFDVLKVQLLGILAIVRGIVDLTNRFTDSLNEYGNKQKTESTQHELLLASGDTSTKANAGDSRDVADLKAKLRQLQLEKISNSQTLGQHTLESANAQEEMRHLVTGDNDPALQALKDKFNAALQATFTNTNNGPAPKYDVADIKDKLQEAKDVYKDAAEKIKESADQQRKQVELDLSSQVISHVEAAAKIKAIVDNEIALRKSAWGVYVGEYQNTVKAIQNAPEQEKKDTDKKQKDLASLQKTFNAENRSGTKSDNSADDLALNAQRAGNSEEIKIAKDHYAALSKLHEEASKYNLVVIKQQHQEGYLTESEAFDREQALAQQDQERKLDDLNASLLDYGTLTEGWKKINDDIGLVYQQDVDRFRLASQQRIDILEKERLARIRHGDQLREVDIQTAEESAAIEDTVNPSKRTLIDDEVYALKQKNLELLIREKEAELAVAAAKNVDSEQTRNLSLQMQGLYNQRLKDTEARLNEAHQRMPGMGAITDRPILKQEVDLAQSDARNANQNRGKFEDANGGIAGIVTSPDPTVLAHWAALDKNVEASEKALAILTAQYVKSAQTWTDAGHNFVNKVVGFNLGDQWAAAKASDQNDQLSNNSNVTGHDAEIAVGAKAVAGAFSAVVNAAASYEQGYKQGGVLGGVGSLVSQFGSMIPGIGGVIASAAGSIMSSIGTILTAAAKHIADDIRTQEQKTMAAYQNNMATLGQTLVAVQAEEAAAISRLSGQKGGQTELDTLLPQLQAQVASLQKQVTDTLSSFSTSLGDLRLHSDTLTAINQQWVQINQQVADYLNANGDAATAQEFLSLQLQQIQKTANEELNQANDQAIQDAIQLNDLLTQKLQLTQQYNQQVFDVVNKDSIERRAGVVQEGQQLSQITAAYNTQLVAIQSQIDLTTQKVTLEGTVFTIAQNITDLHIQDNALQIAALDLQILKYQDLQKIVAGITQNSAGMFSTSAGLFNQLPTTINVALNLAGYTLTATGTITNNGTGTASTAVSPAQFNNNITNSLNLELARRSRMATR